MHERIVRTFEKSWKSRICTNYSKIFKIHIDIEEREQIFTLVCRRNKNLVEFLMSEVNLNDIDPNELAINKSLNIQSKFPRELHFIENGWNRTFVTVNSGVTMRDILNHPEFPWDWDSMHMNPNFNMQLVSNSNGIQICLYSKDNKQESVLIPTFLKDEDVSNYRKLFNVVINLVVYSM